MTKRFLLATGDYCLTLARTHEEALEFLLHGGRVRCTEVVEEAWIKDNPEIRAWAKAHDIPILDGPLTISLHGLWFEKREPCHWYEFEERKAFEKRMKAEADAARKDTALRRKCKERELLREEAEARPKEWFDD